MHHMPSAPPPGSQKLRKHTDHLCEVCCSLMDMKGRNRDGRTYIFVILRIIMLCGWGNKPQRYPHVVSHTREQLCQRLDALFQ